MDSARSNMAAMTDDELEQRLFDLGQHIAWPATPDLDWHAAGQSPVRFVQRRRLWLAAAIIAIAMGAALALSQGFRDTVAGVFGVRGIDIVLLREDDSEPSSDLPVISKVTVGQPVSLDDAAGAVPYPLALPQSLSDPSALYLRELPGGDFMVTAVYEPSEGIPETAETGVGILLMQFTTRSDTPALIKGLDPNYAAMLEVDVNGADGIWISGVTQLTILTDPSIGLDGTTTRPSANVLIWRMDGVAYRLESSLPLPDALDIARSMQAVDE